MLKTNAKQEKKDKFLLQNIKDEGLCVKNQIILVGKFYCLKIQQDSFFIYILSTKKICMSAQFCRQLLKNLFCVVYIFFDIVFI